MHRSPAIVGLIIGSIYAVIYLALAIGAAGAGHGTNIFFAPILPYGLGLLLFPLLGLLAANPRLYRARVVFTILIILHYALTINSLRQDWVSDLGPVAKMWQFSRIGIMLPALFYLLGQAALWTAFISNIRKLRNATGRLGMHPGQSLRVGYTPINRKRL